MLLVFRACAGLCAATTVPTSMSIIVQTFREPKEKSRVLGIFAASGGVGNCVGLIVGGVLSAHVSWRWIYYLLALCIIPFSVASVFVLPNIVQPKHDTKRSLDLPGVGILTAALILFVYAISDGNARGWSSPLIIATLVPSAILLIVFFLVERYIRDPAVPPRTWRIRNFTPLFIYAWRYVSHTRCMSAVNLMSFA